ncbi:MAG: hypothetical protein KME16_13350 [Scytolyngbya sp. HA4215-MV1]|nr:hypothetical protein [Scytolyngbya sp. HA4215-MV1]
MGCYVVVNKGGQSDKDVTACIAIFYEHDNLPKEKQTTLWKALGLPEPSIQIDTGGKSIHSYWVFSEPIEPECWRILQIDLLNFADGDRSLKNPSRVMRLAGCYHKGTGQQSQIISHSGRRYSFDELRVIIPESANQSVEEISQTSHDISSSSDGIPLHLCLTKEHRNWIESGVEEGTRNNSGAALARDLIGAANHLASIRQGYQPSARELFDDFCDRCHPPLDTREREQIWKSAESKNPKPSLSSDAITNCIEGWKKRESKAKRQKSPKAKKQPQQSQQLDEGRGEPEGLPKTSILASELAEKYRPKWLYSAENQTWYWYELDYPGVWSAQSIETLQSVIQQELDADFRNTDGYSLETVRSILGLLKGYLVTPKWEEKPGLLPFRNGVLELATGQLLDHAPGYRLTWSLPRNHDPTAQDWSKISAWLDEATANKPKIKHILLCWLNACLKGRYELQRFLHLTGWGGSGKGTFMRLTTNLVGSENTHSTSLQDWINNRFESANAYKKRLVVFWDEDKFNGSLGKFKSLTGGDFIRGEFKNKNVFQFIYEGMVMLSSNFPIFTGDSSAGIARRALVIPFNQVVPMGKRRNLDEEFEPELAALTNYVLTLSDEDVKVTLLQSQDESSEVVAQTWDYRIRTDNIELG